MNSLLIIDDDPLLRDALHCVFQDAYRTHVVASAEEATPVLADIHPDIVLLDLVLPGMGGLPFLLHLQKAYPDVPVVVISGSATNRDAVEAFEAGAADFVRKPFDVSELRWRLARALNPKPSTKCGARPPWENQALPLKEAVEMFERDRIQTALAACGGVISQAAERMGTTRRILQYRIQKLGLHIT